MTINRASYLEVRQNGSADVIPWVVDEAACIKAIARSYSWSGAICKIVKVGVNGDRAVIWKRGVRA